MLATTLSGLRDIEGVVGSFVLDARGQVLDADLPAFFDAQALLAAAPRLGRLIETLASSHGTLHQAVLRFSTHRLWLQPGRGILLCILVPHECNFSALRMAANLVAKRLATAPCGAPESSGVPLPIEPSPSVSGSRVFVGSDRVEDVAAQSDAHLTAGSPSSSRSSGTWWRSRVPGSSSSSSTRRQFRGRPIDDDSAE